MKPGFLSVLALCAVMCGSLLACQKPVEQNAAVQTGPDVQPSQTVDSGAELDNGVAVVFYDCAADAIVCDVDAVTATVSAQDVSLTAGEFAAVAVVVKKQGADETGLEPRSIDSTYTQFVRLGGRSPAKDRHPSLRSSACVSGRFINADC